MKVNVTWKLSKDIFLFVYVHVISTTKNVTVRDPNICLKLYSFIVL